MGKRHLLLIATVVLAFAVYAGCSEDNLLNTPTGSSYPYGMPVSVPFSMVGPSDVVMCIDVSDSIDAGELAAVVEALGASLSDPDLVPQDGMVSVAALVYGDTVALVYPLTPVTSDNLTNTILPGLQGLLADRLVGGAGFDLAGALFTAGTILEEARFMDRHILIAGSGEADDPDSVTTLCQTLGEAGIMISVVAVSPGEAGSALLEGCAMGTGGFFGAGSSGFEEITDEALAYMLHVDIDLEPEQMERPRGEDHTVEATVYRAGDPETYPVVGIDVTITVVEGPNLGETATGQTDDSGMFAFTYNGAGGPGTDVIVASALHPGTGTDMADTVTVTWLNTPPVCDAGGPYEVSFDADTAMVQLDASGSTDADGDTLTFFWTAYCEGVEFDDASSATPLITVTGDCLCEDSIAVEVMVSDGFDTTTCGTAVYLEDLRAPVLVVKEEPYLLWPPNHKRHEIEPEMLLEYAEDACGRPIDLSGVVIVSVSSDEPEDDKGDGKSLMDIIVGCPNHLRLRAERMGGGNGRVYTIVYRITAENGVSTDAEAYVIVPHDASDPHAVKDDGGGYEVIPGCGD